MTKALRRSGPPAPRRSYRLTIDVAGRDMAVEVTHRNMKSLRLRVMPTGEVRLSVPRRCARGTIDAFLLAQRGWIEGRLADYERRYPRAERFSLRDGGRVRILGVDRSVGVAKRTAGGPPQFHLTPAGLMVSAADPGDGAAIAQAFEKWWRAQAMACYRDALARIYPVVAGEIGLPAPPTLHMRRMRSRWGSCSYTKGRINLNVHLYQAPQACVDYVMLHELAHFPHHSHDGAFYAFVAGHMPDFRAREQLLDGEMIPGEDWPMGS